MKQGNDLNPFTNMGENGQQTLTDLMVSLVDPSQDEEWKKRAQAMQSVLVDDLKKRKAKKTTFTQKVRGLFSRLFGVKK